MTVARHSRPPVVPIRVAVWLVAILIGSANMAAEERPLTLFVSGMGPVSSVKSAEVTWGEWQATKEGRLAWSGMVGHLIRQGWKFGGILRSKSENVTTDDLDTTGAATEGKPDFYLLGSSIPAQNDGLESRARELATAVRSVCQLSGQRRIQVVAYSGGGVAARAWMQGAAGPPYEDHAVSHLVTVASPHMGVGGIVGPFSRQMAKYAGLQSDSPILRRMNSELDLPADTWYSTVVIQGTGTSLADSGRAYRDHVRLSESQLEGLPPLMRYGHDGAVHCLSAQLQLTPAAARYESRTERPIDVRFCRLSAPHGDQLDSILVHTAALSEPRLWDALTDVISRPPEWPPKPVAILRHRDAWLHDLASHWAESECQRKHPAGRIVESRVVRLLTEPQSNRVVRCRWLYRCDVETQRLFGGTRTDSYAVSGSFEISWDRFERPENLSRAAVAVEPWRDQSGGK